MHSRSRADQCIITQQPAQAVPGRSSALTTRLFHTQNKLPFPAHPPTTLCHSHSFLLSRSQRVPWWHPNQLFSVRNYPIPSIHHLEASLTLSLLSFTEVTAFWCSSRIMRRVPYGCNFQPSSSWLGLGASKVQKLTVASLGTLHSSLKTKESQLFPSPGLWSRLASDHYFHTCHLWTEPSVNSGRQADSFLTHKRTKTTFLSPYLTPP